MLIFALTDERNQQPGNLTPILIGLVVVVIECHSRDARVRHKPRARLWTPADDGCCRIQEQRPHDGGYVFWVHDRRSNNRRTDRWSGIRPVIRRFLPAKVAATLERSRTLPFNRWIQART